MNEQSIQNEIFSAKLAFFVVAKEAKSWEELQRFTDNIAWDYLCDNSYDSVDEYYDDFDEDEWEWEYDDYDKERYCNE